MCKHFILAYIISPLVISFLCLSTAFCQSATNKKNDDEGVRVGAIIPLENITRMVVNLREPASKGEKVGTGTLIVFQDRPYVLTANHVANDISIDGRIVVKGKGDTPVVIPIKKLVSNSKLNWKTHPKADIAIFEIVPQDEQTSALLQKRFLPLEFFSKEEAAPSRDLFLTSVGFPLGLGIYEHFSPLTFESKASSGLLSLPRADTKTIQTFFALENPSVGGYSGCPVVDLSIFKAGAMTATGSGTCFYGVMHGTISDETGGKIALVTPSFYVYELFNAL
jgi:hypothetical protein